MTNTYEQIYLEMKSTARRAHSTILRMSQSLNSYKTPLNQSFGIDTDSDWSDRLLDEEVNNIYQSKCDKVRKSNKRTKNGK